MHPSRRQFLQAATAACALPAGSRVFAQASGPISIVVPFAAGGAADVVARAVGLGMSTHLGRPVVIENKGGAAGLIGATAVARAAPDGTTLMLATDGIFSNPALAKPQAQEILGKLVPVANFAEAPLALAVSTDFPGRTIAEIVQEARKRNAPLSYGTSGVGTAHHLAGELLARMAGIKMTAIAYRGTSAAANDLASGTIDILFGNLTGIQPLVAAGKARLVAVTSLQPFRLTPDVPTVAQTYKGYEMMVNFGVVAPPGTPPAVVAQLAGAAEKALSMRQVRDSVYGAGLAPAYLDPKAYAKLLNNTTATRRKLIAEAGIQAE